jgi:hypothetical protein
MRRYTIWPADRNDLPSTQTADWHQSVRWLVLDVTDVTDMTDVKDIIESSHAVEGPISRLHALVREQEIRAVDRATEKARRRAG